MGKDLQAMRDARMQESASSSSEDEQEQEQTAKAIS